MDQMRAVVAFHSPFYTPLHVAHRLGAFRQEGLDVSITTPPPGGSVDMILDGRADIALSGVMRGLVLADCGGPRLVAIAEVNSRDGFFLLSRRPLPGFRWRDLEGARLALFGLAPTPWMCLQDVLRRHGGDPAKVITLPGLDPAAGVAALSRGEADFLQAGQPTAEELVDAGAAHIAAAQAPGVGHVPYSSLIVTPEVMRSRPELCERAVRALARALVWLRAQDGPAVADLIAPDFPEIPRARLGRVVARYLSAGTWAEGPRQDRDAFDRLAGALVSGGLIGRAAPYTALVDDRFAVAATLSAGAPPPGA